MVTVQTQSARNLEDSKSYLDNCESQPSSSANTDSMTIKETTMKQLTPKLTKDLHLRLDEDFQNQLIKIANENNLKPSTFARIVLQRTVPQYSRVNRTFA